MLYINAWLDRANPYIRIMDKESGDTLIQFEGQEVIECLERGDVCLQDLQASKPSTQHEVVKQLLLTRCSKNLGQTPTPPTTYPSRTANLSTKVLNFDSIAIYCYTA